ncbi:hypothetical protein [Echinicola sp. 20G]|uniref:hypothetical protein n=1 Tax=Echinicola sp. 20G TaxID=2781961 RepID=UPI00190FDDB3|nr:hypothetical protein [Echinicola sp. 20G]
MSKKNINSTFDDRNLPHNPMSQERMEELEKKFAPFVEELKQKLNKEPKSTKLPSSSENI